MTTMNSNEREEQLKQVRERWSRMNMPQTVFTAHCKGDIDFLLSLLDDQVKRPAGWISCGLRHGNDRAVDMIFENAECAKAFIDGVEPTNGPIVAATRMREACVEKVRASGVYWREVSKQFQRGDEEFAFFTAKAKAADDIERDLQSLTLAQVEKKQ